MTIAFAAAIGHAPGWVAWTERATDDQRANLAAAMATLRGSFVEAKLDVLILLTSEHWANFFLDHMSPWVVGRGETFEGPIEPWMKIPRTAIPGDPALADAIVERAYAVGVEPAFSYELKLDHGSVVPLSFLTPDLDMPVVPVFFNTLGAPQPSPARCHALGRVIGDIARGSDKRIGIIATGGMSHDPGEVGHGVIDSAFDHRFLDEMARGDTAALTRYTIADLNAAGAGTIELIAWIALAGALGDFSGETLAYEPVVGWATGMGIMRLTPADEDIDA